MKKIIAGNWKMNGTPDETRERLEKMKTLIEPGEDEVIVFPPFVSLAVARECLAGTAIACGAQNVHYAEKGAYTGEISLPMLRELGVRYVLIGHSERRQHFGETDELLQKKVAAAIEANVVPVFCIGETLAERESGMALNVLSRQIEEGLRDLPPLNKDHIILAYEPVWAIGTGVTATPEDANTTMASIRDTLVLKGHPKNLSLLYGGSAKPDNAAALLNMQNIDGLLIGGASLEPESFAAMVHWRES